MVRARPGEAALREAEHGAVVSLGSDSEVAGNWNVSCWSRRAGGADAGRGSCAIAAVGAGRSGGAGRGRSWRSSSPHGCRSRSDRALGACGARQCGRDCRGAAAGECAGHQQFERGDMSLLPEVESKADEARQFLREKLAGAEDACVTSSFQAEDVVVLHMAREFLPGCAGAFSGDRLSLSGNAGVSRPHDAGVGSESDQCGCRSNGGRRRKRSSGF